MNSSLLEKNIVVDNYKDYIEKLLNVFRLSTKESSIICDIVIEEYKCICKLSVIKLNGEHSEYSDVAFSYDLAFLNTFIHDLVEGFKNNIDCINYDVVNDSNSDLVTFRIITNNNDLFTINGLSLNDAKQLVNLCNNNIQKGLLKSTDSLGISNTKMFIFMIIVLIISIVLVVIFV